jgi:hypothetical protein
MTTEKERDDRDRAALERIGISSLEEFRQLQADIIQAQADIRAIKAKLGMP